MCGILGVVGSVAEEAPIRKGLSHLGHRGPDAQGIEVLTGSSMRCVLGHTRLRVIDLSPEADQPLANEDHTVWVSYNGEIYNHQELRAELEEAGHRFRSRSDTEVLVHLYEACRGEPAEMLGRLRGMFAFVLVDLVRSRVLLARDRMGIKPLYLAETGGELLFASEVRALARTGMVSDDPDAGAVLGYLQRGVVPGGRTLFSEIQELAPGSYALWEGGELKQQRWWAPQVEPVAALADDAERLMGAALSDAVDRHLVADRPVGIFLSGGTDSAAVATLAAAHGRMKALTVTFPHASSEEEGAAALAQTVGAEHQQVPVTGDEVAGHLEEILASMDQPTSDGVNTWVVCRAAKKAGLVVALSGLGGDEIFGGYPSFRMVPRVAFAQRAFGIAPRRMLRLGAQVASSRRPGGRVSRTLGTPGGLVGAYAATRNLFSPWETGGSLNGLRNPGELKGSPGDQVMLLEMANYLPDQLLRDTDQMSMAHSLEVRVPLLDDMVVRVALRLPSQVRLAPGKRLLAAAAGLQDSLPKRPFSLPFDTWMRGPLREPVRQGLLSEELPFAEEVPREFRHRVWAAFEERRAHWSRPWAVAVLRLWPEASGFRW